MCRLRRFPLEPGVSRQYRGQGLHRLHLHRRGCVRRPHISYDNGPAGDLKYAVYNGSTWDIETVDTTGDVADTHPSPSMPAGRPHISYADYTNRDLKYATH